MNFKQTSIPPPTDEKTSTLIRRILSEIKENNVCIGYIVIQLRRRSFGGILIMLALFGLIPGISIFAGLLMIVIGFQMFASFRAPLLPKFIRAYKIDVILLRKIGNNIVELIKKLELFIEPRWLFLTLPPMPSLIGVLIIGLAIVVMLPLPFSNLPPAFALLFLAIGLLERDGVIIMIGIAISIVALLIGVIITNLALETLLLLFENRN